MLRSIAAEFFGGAPPYLHLSAFVPPCGSPRGMRPSRALDPLPPNVFLLHAPTLLQQMRGAPPLQHLWYRGPSWLFLPTNAPLQAHPAHCDAPCSPPHLLPPDSSSLRSEYLPATLPAEHAPPAPPRPQEWG